MKDYFYNELPTKLNEYINIVNKQENQPQDCEHHNIPEDRAVVLDEKLKEDKKFNHKFWYGWYILNLLDQAIHFHYRENYVKWQKNTNGYPIPMLNDAGFGCWRISHPASLLTKIKYIKKDWVEACDFFAEEMAILLKEKAGIEAHELALKIITDIHFGKNRHEKELSKRLKDFYKL